MLVDAFFLAFSMFSAIPMPQRPWNEQGMRYVFCFFPLVALPIGVLLLCWSLLAQWLELGPLLTGAGMTLLPIAVTGGLHMDGLCDVCDALGSRQPRERMLEIMKDPRCGGFGALGLGCYLLLYFAAASQLVFTPARIAVFSCMLTLIRTFSGLAVCHMPTARAGGVAGTFAAGARRDTVSAVLVLTAAAAIGTAIWIEPLAGICAGILTSGCCFVCLRIASRRFGGITGDLAGWMLQLCELCALLGLVVAS